MLTQSQQRILQALLSSRTQAEAAAVAHCTPKTIRACLKDKEFAAEYRAAYDAIFESSARTAERAINPALAVLEEISKDEAASPAVRVAAAVNLVKIGREMRESGDFMRRLEALEDAIEH